MIRELLAVGLGGGAGSILRYVLAYGLWAGRTWWGFPVGTFAVNAGGSLLIGWALVRLAERPLLMQWVSVGFCGGFTTFSTFSADTVRLLKAGQYGPAAAYAGLSVAVCLACVVLGMWFGQLLKN